MPKRDPLSLLSGPAKNARSSVIRDLLAHAKRPGVISLAGGIPDPELFPIEQVIAASNRVLTADRGVLQYGLTAGEERTRLAVAPLLGVPVDPERVVVTTGSQQGLDLIAKATVDSGDTIVVGDPSYLGALQAFRSHSASMLPIPVDESGIVVDVLETLLEASGPGPKFVYVVANFQNPTGAVLSEPRRDQLVRLAERHGFLIVEDDPYGQLRFDGRALPVIGVGSEHVVRLRSTSKVLAPGLRVGWMEGPQWLIDAVTIAKQSADLHTSTLSQAIAAELLADADWFEGHVERIRDEYRHRRDALCEALDTVFGGDVAYQRPEGGMFVWATFAGIDAAALLPAALERGVAYVPASAFAVDLDRGATARLSFATVEPAEFLVAIGRLADTFRRRAEQ